jgi:hypothetical protein
MYLTIFRIIWPYLFRYITNQGSEYAANYLQTRREQREQQTEEPEVLEPLTIEEVEPISQIESMEELRELICPPPKRFLSSDAFWFILSGISLGVAFSLIVAYLFKRND